MLARMIDKTAQTETLLVEKAEIDALKREIRHLNNQIAFYKLAAFELEQYEKNYVCNAVMSIWVFLKNAATWIKGVYYGISEKRNNETV